MKLKTARRAFDKATRMHPDIEIAMSVFILGGIVGLYAWTAWRNSRGDSPGGVDVIAMIFKRRGNDAEDTTERHDTGSGSGAEGTEVGDRTDVEGPDPRRSEA